MSRRSGCGPNSRALGEVEAGRSRLLRARYRERRRLERDLYDGAPSRRVTLGMALRLAQRHLDDGTVDVDGLLDEAVAGAASAPRVRTRGVRISEPSPPPTARGSGAAVHEDSEPSKILGFAAHDPSPAGHTSVRPRRAPPSRRGFPLPRRRALKLPLAYKPHHDACRDQCHVPSVGVPGHGRSPATDYLALPGTPPGDFSRPPSTRRRA